jgi:hypothetical protein
VVAAVNDQKMSASLLVTIERILPGGVGLAHAEGKTVFVSLAAAGDKARIRIDREQGNLLLLLLSRSLNHPRNGSNHPVHILVVVEAAIFSS